MDRRINPTTHFFFFLILDTELKEDEMATSKGQTSGIIHSPSLIQLQFARLAPLPLAV